MAKTALELTPVEMRRYRLSEAVERREKAQGTAVDVRKREAWSIAGTAAQLLRKEFGAQKVVVFGSLAHEKGFSLWSDIDLFHIVRHLIEAVDKVRRMEAKALAETDSEILKGTRYIWLKNPWNLTEKQKVSLTDLLNMNLKIVKAISHRARGYRTEETFSLAMIHGLGKLDLPKSQHTFC